MWELRHEKSLIFFFEDFLKYEPFLKSLLNELQYGFCFVFWVFMAMSHVRSWLPKPITPVLENKMSTTGPPGKSQEIYFLILL